MEQIRDTRGELLASFQHHHIDIIITLPIIVNFDNIITLLIIVFFTLWKWSSTVKKLSSATVELHFFTVELYFFSVKKGVELHHRKCTKWKVQHKESGEFLYFLPVRKYQLLLFL